MRAANAIARARTRERMRAWERRGELERVCVLCVCVSCRWALFTRCVWTVQMLHVTLVLTRFQTECKFSPFCSLMMLCHHFLNNSQSFQLLLCWCLTVVGMILEEVPPCLQMAVRVMSPVCLLVCLPVEEKTRNGDKGEDNIDQSCMPHFYDGGGTRPKDVLPWWWSLKKNAQ